MKTHKKQAYRLIISVPNENSQKASISVYVLAACSQDGLCMNGHQNTRPERNLEKLLHELKKCDWKTVETQKMRSINAEQGQAAPKQRKVSRHFEKFKLLLRE